jgi:type IV pilus assembly protein PilC
MSSVVTQSFAYRGRNSAGRIVKGKVDAPNETAVVARMRGLGLSPVSISVTAQGTGLNRDLNLAFLERGPSLKDLAVMSRQLATMTLAGLTLIRSLSILEGQTENKILMRALEASRGAIEGGTSLSQAFAQHPRVFPPLMIHLVRAGEAGGFLDEALESVASTFEADHKLRTTIKSALAYPVVVLCMAFVAVIAMLLFVVPIFEDMFDNFGAQLPLPTRILVMLSKSMGVVAPVLLVVIVAFALWWRKNKHTERVRSVVDPLRLKLPVFGELFTKVAVARFARNFATMSSSGVPVLQTLSIVGETSGSWVIERAAERIADSVRSGGSIAGPMAKEPLFPSMVTQMVSVGEESGALDTMLHKVADFYDAEVSATTEQLTSLIEPLMIAVIGVVIGSMIVALYMPVFSIFNEIQ